MCRGDKRLRTDRGDTTRKRRAITRFSLYVGRKAAVCVFETVGVCLRRCVCDGVCVCVSVPVLLSLLSPAMCRLYCLSVTTSSAPPPSSSSITHPLPVALLCYFKWSSASWDMQCLCRACLVTYGGDGSPLKTTIPIVPRGHIKVSDYNTLEGEEDGGGSQRAIWSLNRKASL